MKWWCLLAGAFAAAAQTDEVRVSAHVYTPPQLRLAVQAQLVQLEVVVRDPQGQSVGGLSQSDFEIFDEGKPRQVTAFSVASREAAPPALSTLLFFDDLHVAPAELQHTQIAARRFIQDGLGPRARAAVYAASEGLVLDFTDDPAALADAIQKLRPHPRIPENGMQSCPHITPLQAYLIDNNLDSSAFHAALQEALQCPNADAPQADQMAIAVRAQASAAWRQARRDSLNSFEAVNRALAMLDRAPGTRVLLLVSTGFLSGTLEEELSATIDRAIRAGIVINALDAKGLWPEPPGRSFGEAAHTTSGFAPASPNDAVNAVMAEFASATGGLFFHDSSDLTGGFRQLGAVPETTYVLAFRPDAEGAGKYHQLKVRLAGGRRDYVQARPGYFAPANAPTAPAGVRPLDRQALAADVLTEIPISLSGEMSRSENGEPTVSLAIHVDLAALRFTTRGGRSVQSLAFIGALLDAEGNIIAAKEGGMDFALKKGALARLTASGVNAWLSLSAPPGQYRVRIVVADADGKMASLNHKLELPAQVPKK